MPDTERDDTTKGVPTNLRLLMLLEYVAAAGVPITPTKANAELQLPKPTVHRLFATLEREGFLQRDIDGKSYSPGPRLRRLSINILSSLRIRTARLAVLNGLADKVGETCNIAMPDRDCMVYLERVETKWPLRIQLPIGTEVPFHCTASGKMYLSTLRNSHLQQYLASANLERHTSRSMVDVRDLMDEIKAIQARGFSTDDEEFLDGMIAVAVPIMDDRGRLLSTLSVHAPTQRISLEALQDHVPLIAATADKLSRLLTDE